MPPAKVCNLVMEKRFKNRKVYFRRFKCRGSNEIVLLLLLA
jgi:hypothetical protein